MTTEYCESCPDNICRCGRPTAYFVQNDHGTLYKRLVRQHFNEIRQYPAFVQSQTSGYQDVQNGQAYKERLKEVPISHTPLPMNLFVDGGSFSNSTTTQTWPICLSLLSLDPVRRQSAKNVLIIGFWHGPKPNWAFIAKRIAECVNCSVVIDGFPYYVFIAVLTADMPGRAAFLNAMNHGAIDACLFCDVKGTKDAGKGMQYDVIGVLRTVEQFWADARAADVLNSRGRKKMEHVGASKGTCGTLTLLKTPTEVAIDAMHTTYEGPPRDDLEKLVEGNKDAKILKLDPEERQEIEDVIGDIPWAYECDRKLRSLGDSKRWKASEWALFVTAVAPTILTVVLAPRGLFKHLVCS